MANTYRQVSYEEAKLLTELGVKVMGTGKDSYNHQRGDDVVWEDGIPFSPDGWPNYFITLVE